LYTQEYEFTAVHEAGHAVCIAQFPPSNTALTSLAIPYPEILRPRLTAIEIWYDEEKERYDGWTPYSPDGLQDEQFLFIAFGGRVAELMVRAGGTWDFTTIQKELFSGRFDDTQDMDDIRRYLDRLSINRPREEVLTTTLASVCSALERNWKLVLQVASELLSRYDKDTRNAMITYEELSPVIKAQLTKLKIKHNNNRF
jgi:hypothetical protein